MPINKWLMVAVMWHIAITLRASAYWHDAPMGGDVDDTISFHHCRAMQYDAKNTDVPECVEFHAKNQKCGTTAPKITCGRNRNKRIGKE